MFKHDDLHAMRVLSGIRPTRPSLTEARSGITSHERAAMRARIVEAGGSAKREAKKQIRVQLQMQPQSEKDLLDRLSRPPKRMPHGSIGISRDAVDVSTLYDALSDLKRTGQVVQKGGLLYWAKKSKRNPRLKEAKRPTFKKAAQDIMDYLKSLGWTVQTRSTTNFKPLKFPYAVDPHKEYRIWFKKQAVYLGDNRPGSNINDARSLHIDIRDVSPEQFLQYAKRWMK